MGWSVALACSSVGEPGRVFRPGLAQDPETAAALARRLYPRSSVVETGDTILDFALWPYEDELFVGAYGDALAVCDRRLFGIDDQARTLADEIAKALPGGSCGVLVLHSVVSGCWFRWYEDNRPRRDVFVTADDGVVVDLGDRLPAEAPFWAGIDGGAGDVPLPFDYEEYGMALAREYLFGRDISERGADGFLALELPLRRFKLA
ncbi:hypothetical protein GCM10027176_34100 [Actinoallomurus bryophytorum]|uniref:Uncharacterized protein n=1 Tax=Actinoallomurus bryophytorum TaxID=1490222 RepID=A0A543CVP4_9ACTN|nr:hypothetical protein [Actinoallomurus bryophytorum]TQM01174.1 hypothetical protein FB559_6922 [Actinoallomurus bryophytorum]